MFSLGDALQPAAVPPSFELGAGGLAAHARSTDLLSPAAKLSRVPWAVSSTSCEACEAELQRLQAYCLAQLPSLADLTLSAYPNCTAAPCAALRLEVRRLSLWSRPGPADEDTFCESLVLDTALAFPFDGYPPSP